MNRKKRLTKWVLLVVGVFWLAVAFYGYRQVNGNNSGQLKTVTIGYQKADPIDIAKTRGQLIKKMKKRGYKIIFKEFQDGSALMQALKTGDVDYARTGDTPPVTAQANGSQIAYIAASSSKAKGTGIVVKKNGNIDSITDLKGKKIAYTKNTSSEYLIRKTLKKAGLSTNDVTLVNMSQSSAALAFSKGKIDAWATWDPYTAQGQLQLKGRLLISGTNVTNNRDFIISTQAYAKKNPEISKYLVNYLQDDMQWAQTHHQQLIKMLSKSLGLSDSVIKKMVTRRTYSMGTVNDKILQEQQKIADFFYDEGLIDKKIIIKNETN